MDIIKIMAEEKELITLDSYIKGIKDQNLKGLLLKLKNEIRKEENSWDEIKNVLKKISNYDTDTFYSVVDLIILEE